MRHSSAKLIALLLLALCFSSEALANQQGFGVPSVNAYPSVRPISRMGKVTGEGCISDRDCIVGCTANDPDNLKCLNMDEASNKCVDPTGAPTADYPCVCLTDAKHCGFSFPIAQTEELVVTTQHSVITETHHPRHVKKYTHKKPVAKKKSKKKKTMKKAVGKTMPSASGAASMAAPAVAPAVTSTTTTTTTVTTPVPLPAPASVMGPK